MRAERSRLGTRHGCTSSVQCARTRPLAAACRLTALRRHRWPSCPTCCHCTLHRSLPCPPLSPSLAGTARHILKLTSSTVLLVCCCDRSTGGCAPTTPGAAATTTASAPGRPRRGSWSAPPRKLVTLAAGQRDPTWGRARPQATLPSRLLAPAPGTSHGHHHNTAVLRATWCGVCSVTLRW